MCFALIVDRAARNENGVFGGLLSFAPVRYFGNISNGMNLYHLFLIPMLPKLLKSMGMHTPVYIQLQAKLTPELQFARFFVVSLLTIALAALSWHSIEYPINSLKRYFPYLKSKKLRHR